MCKFFRKSFKILSIRNAYMICAIDKNEWEKDAHQETEKEEKTEAKHSQMERMS